MGDGRASFKGYEGRCGVVLAAAAFCLGCRACKRLPVVFSGGYDMRPLSNRCCCTYSSHVLETSVSVAHSARLHPCSDSPYKIGTYTYVDDSRL